MTQSENLFEDEELLAGFAIESTEGLMDVENQLLSLEKNFDPNVIDNLFRAIHSVKGAAGFMQLRSISALAHGLESLLSRVRSRELIIDRIGVEVLLGSADKLRDMVQQPAANANTDVSECLKKLAQWEKAQDVAKPQSDFFQAVDKVIDHLSEIEATAPDAEPSCSNPTTTAIQSAETLSSVAANGDSTSASVFEGLPQQQLHPREACPSPPVNVTPPVHVAPSAVEQQTAIASTSAVKAVVDPTIRVSVAVLEELVNLAGEMVLSRNQLLRCISDFRSKSLTNIGSRIDQVTTAMQDVIMSARMQQVGIIFNRFPRIVRDLSGKLQKNCRLVIEGAEVELDKTIIEALSDPLTHLIRNSLDHGIESPEKRTAAGKPAEATLRLSAYHEAGKVHIEISDDGQGVQSDKVLAKAVERGVVTPQQAARMSDREIVNLIFMPGFSTAEVVSDVSGRGVGMDVVRTNIERIGGTVDVNSQPGKGAVVHVSLPLTLAIIPSWVVQQGEYRFALPESSIVEFVRLSQRDYQRRIEHIDGGNVMRWRDDLLPLIHLTDCLSGLDSNLKTTMQRPTDAQNIVVVESGKHLFGIVVQKVCDPEQIVVKPIGKHLRESGYLEGAAVLGDGNVAFILGLHGIAQCAQLADSRRMIESAEDAQSNFIAETQTALLFRTAEHRLAAVPRMVIQRIERINVDDLQEVRGRHILPVNGSQLPVIRVPWIDAVERSKVGKVSYLLVFSLFGQEIGLLVPELVDICEIPTSVDGRHANQAGVIGTVLIDGQVVEVLDVYELAEKILGLSQKKAENHSPNSLKEGKKHTVLLAEDTPFFRNQVQKFLLQTGYNVLIGNDGLEAWGILQENVGKIDLVLTDIEMPRMNGYELAKFIRQDPQFDDLPIIAITSLHADESLAKGHLVGIDDWKIKLDRDELLAAIQIQLCSKKRVSVSY